MLCKILDEIPYIAAIAERHAEDALERGDDIVASRMFQISEAADEFYLALSADRWTDHLVCSFIA